MANNSNNKIDFNRWESWGWKSYSRYYHLSLSQTLFGEWVVTKKWGGLHTNIHGAKKHYCNPSTELTDEVAAIFAEVHKKRIARGYALDI